MTFLEIVEIGGRAVLKMLFDSPVKEALAQCPQYICQGDIAGGVLMQRNAQFMSILEQGPNSSIAYFQLTETPAVVPEIEARLSQSHEDFGGFEYYPDYANPNFIRREVTSFPPDTYTLGTQPTSAEITQAVQSVCANKAWVGVLPLNPFSYNGGLMYTIVCQSIDWNQPQPAWVHFGELAVNSWLPEGAFLSLFQCSSALYWTAGSWGLNFGNNCGYEIAGSYAVGPIPASPGGSFSALPVNFFRRRKLAVALPVSLSLDGEPLENDGSNLWI